MPTTSSNQWTRVTRGTQSDEGWLQVGHYDPGFVASVQMDLDALSSLAPNWDGYGAPVIDPKIIQAAKQFIATLPDNLAFRPRIVPTSNGSLQMEWHEGPKTLELEFESPRSIRYLQWNPPKGEEDEDTISVKDTDRAVDLIHWFMIGACL